MANEEHTVNLFARYEQRLFSDAANKPRVIPAVVITGFLGAGKTSLVQHILRNRGSLKIAVLINEVGQIDIDSALVNAKQAHAALGLPAADLSGGCICCAKSADLAAALHALRASAAAAPSTGPAATPHGASGGASGGGGPDYLLVETSGAADAGPLAEALTGAGFRLDGVVAVVDAEAGRGALAHPVAAAQIAAADTVVLNKCDLVAAAPGGLGALAELEDALAGAAPGVRLVRARFGEVPLTTVLDVEPVEPAAGRTHGSVSGGGEGAAGTEGPGGGGGFMSHESMPVGGGGYRLAAGPAGPLTADGLAVGSRRHAQRRGVAAGVPQQPGAPHPATPAIADPHHHHRDHHHHHSRDHTQHPDGSAQHPLHPHSALHDGFYTEGVAMADAPLRLGAFAAFVTRCLVREPALLRCKGVLWVSECRAQRLTFHLSGRRRVECSAEGPWEGPPSTQLVFIGTDPAAMTRLRSALLAHCVAWRGAQTSPPKAEEEEEADEEAVAAAAAARLAAHERLQVLSPLPPPSRAAAPRGDAVPGPGEAHPQPREHQVQQHGSGGLSGGGGGGVVCFTARGSPLHGISGEELNGELARAANARGGVLVVGVTAPGAVSAATMLRARDRVVSLMLPLPAALPLAPPEHAGQGAGPASPQAPPPPPQLSGEALAGEVLAAAEPLLRRAYAHVHNCKCDVASAAAALRG